MPDLFLQRGTQGIKCIMSQVFDSRVGIRDCSPHLANLSAIQHLSCSASHRGWCCSRRANLSAVQHLSCSASQFEKQAIQPRSVVSVHQNCKIWFVFFVSKVNLAFTYLISYLIVNNDQQSSAFPMVILTLTSLVRKHEFSSKAWGLHYTMFVDPSFLSMLF
jgi:hypothetical protein